MRGPALLDPIGAFSGPEAHDDAGPFASRGLSYPALLGASWLNLPGATRARFERHDARYVGTMALRASRIGRWVERMCRLVGSPLPPDAAAPVPATVDVEPDPATGGSRWVRHYEYGARVVSIISVKALDRDGTLVERLPMGLRMRLAIEVRGADLHFVSRGYYVELPGLPLGGTRRCAWRFGLPDWWLPGETHVVHRDLGDGRFSFTMTVRHPLLGQLFHHEGVFRAEEVSPCA